MRGFAGLGRLMGEVVLRPSLAFLPKVLSDLQLSQMIELYPSFCPQADGEQKQRRFQICSVKVLEFYIRAALTCRVTDNLFVCFKPEWLSRPLSKARLSHWITEVIQQVYKIGGVPALPEVRAHYSHRDVIFWVL